MRPPSARPVLRALWWVHRAWWRVSGGRIGARVAGLPVLELITNGRVSGKPRSVLLNFIEHAEGVVVVGSNAGADTQPAWWRNLEANNSAQVRRAGSIEPVVARELAGPERDDVWMMFVAANGAYAAYAGATTRPIPVVLLGREPA
ncbi:MAG: nitroreductase/quinone reductase family protein [Actinomycetota bacterium]